MDKWQSKEQRWEDSKREGKRRKNNQKKEEKTRLRNTLYIFQYFVGPKRSKSRVAKVAGAEPSSQLRDQEKHAVAAGSTCRNQNVKKTPQVQGTFGS